MLSSLSLLLPSPSHCHYSHCDTITTISFFIILRTTYHESFSSMLYVEKLIARNHTLWCPYKKKKKCLSFIFWFSLTISVIFFFLLTSGSQSVRFLPLASHGHILVPLPSKFYCSCHSLFPQPAEFFSTIPPPSPVYYQLWSHCCRLVLLYLLWNATNFKI